MFIFYEMQKREPFTYPHLTIIFIFFLIPLFRAQLGLV